MTYSPVGSRFSIVLLVLGWGLVAVVKFDADGLSVGVGGRRGEVASYAILKRQCPLKNMPLTEVLRGVRRDAARLRTLR